MSCPQDPIPAGWYVWRGTSVPTELTQFAMDVRDHVLSFPFGTIARTIQYQGKTVGAFVSRHTWTYRGGQLVTGICIPGVSLVIQQTPPAGTGALGALVSDNLDTPDPSAAVYGADDEIAQEPPASTDWSLVAVSVGAMAAVTAGFWLALKHAGRAGRSLAAR